MFVLKNAWSSIVRRKWRTLLTMFIAIIVTFGTLFGFSVLHADESATDGYNPQLISAVIRPDAKTKATYNGADSSYTKNYLAFDAYDNYASALQAAGLTYSYALTITVPVRQSGDVKAIAGTDDQSADFDGLAPHKYSERTAEVIDEEVLGLVETAHTEAWNIINDNRDVLDELVRQLLVKETLNEKELAAIFANIRKAPERPVWLSDQRRPDSDKPPVEIPESLKRSVGMKPGER